MARLKTWPFDPAHITNDGERVKGKERLCGEGIIPSKHLLGLQTAICAALEHPTTVIEFAPDSSLPTDEACIRTDSKLLFYNMRPMCTLFRQETNEQCCIHNDNIHAVLFRGLRRNEIRSRVMQQAEASPEIAAFRRNREQTFAIASHRRTGAVSEPTETISRPYLEYDCPILGYRELLFPIFIEDRVIAVFFVGQLCLQEKLGFIARKQREYFSNPSACFLPLLASHGDLSAPDLVSALQKRHEDWIRDPKNVLSSEKYVQQIDRICVELDEFEIYLHGQLDMQRHDYVRQSVDSTINFFLANMPNDLEHSDLGLYRAWSFIGDRIGELADAFAIDYVIVFGMSTFLQDGSKKLPVVACVGRKTPPEVLAKIPYSTFDLSKIAEDDLRKYAATPDSESLFRGLGSLLNVVQRDRVRVRVIPAPSLTHGTIIFLLGYGVHNGPERKENEIGEYLDSALHVFNGIVVSTLSSLVAASAQTRMETVLRIFGHEAGQLTTGLEGLRMNYLTNAMEIAHLSLHKLDDISRNFKAYIKQLNLLSSNVRAVLTLSKPNKQDFMAYRELLFKWRDVYRQEAIRKSLILDIAFTEANDPLRPAIYADLRLMEQLVYNLVNNAVKYCYRGTRIWLDCAKREPGPGRAHYLTVIDYGTGIPEEDRTQVFELYYRGREVVKRDSSGLGIGLFIAGKIAQAHGGDIVCLCEKISDYNVPLIEPYLRLAENTRIALSRTLLKDLPLERERLEAAGVYDQVVARTEKGHLLYEPTRLEIINSIQLPTYKVTFQARIPAKEGQV